MAIWDVSCEAAAGGKSDVESLTNVSDPPGSKSGSTLKPSDKYIMTPDSISHVSTAPDLRVQMIWLSSSEKAADSGCSPVRFLECKTIVRRDVSRIVKEPLSRYVRTRLPECEMVTSVDDG